MKLASNLMADRDQLRLLSSVLMTKFTSLKRGLWPMDNNEILFLLGPGKMLLTLSGSGATNAHVQYQISINAYSRCGDS